MKSNTTSVEPNLNILLKAQLPEKQEERQEEAPRLDGSNRTGTGPCDQRFFWTGEEKFKAAGYTSHGARGSERRDSVFIGGSSV